MRDLIGLRARLLLPLPACEEVDENTEGQKHGFVFTIVSRFQMQAPSPGQANSEIARSLVAPFDDSLFQLRWDHFVFRYQSNQSQRTVCSTPITDRL